MLDMPSDANPPQPTNLAQYRPPPFVIDAVELSFALGEAETRVKSRLALRRNPASSERDAPLRLDGEALQLVSLALDGTALAGERYRLEPDGSLVLPDMPDAFALDIETRIEP